MPRTKSLGYTAFLQILRFTTADRKHATPQITAFQTLKDLKKKVSHYSLRNLG